MIVCCEREGEGVRGGWEAGTSHASSGWGRAARRHNSALCGQMFGVLCHALMGGRWLIVCTGAGRKLCA